MNPEVQRKKFEAWKHGLLDVGKRNKMMNYRKTKRATLQIVAPSFDVLFQKIAVNEEPLLFRRRVDTSSAPKLSQVFYLMDKLNAPIELFTGDLASDVSLSEMNITLRQLRAKSKLSLEEQGINILYLSFGFLEWRQKANDAPILSPLILVPVSLELESIVSPYKIKKTDEDVVVNPTLEYVLTSDYGLKLPEFDPAEDSISDYLNDVQKIASKNGWRVISEVNLGLLSFLKIVMYKDLDKYRDRIFANPVIKAFCGDPSYLPQVESEWHDVNHDSVPSNELYQVVNADASQQDAIMLSKKGISFVLQGPPGTGKSQTITNIIAEALASGKRVLFVSEKMAALSVVYRRLQDVGLADYCLPLHNYKAEKRTVIHDLVTALDSPRKKLRNGSADFLDELDEEKAKLNAYFDELYLQRIPLNRSIYDVISELALYTTVPQYLLNDSVADVTEQAYRVRIASLKKLYDFIERYDGDIYTNPWSGTNIASLTYEIRSQIPSVLEELSPRVLGLSTVFSYISSDFTLDVNWTWKSIQKFIGQLHWYEYLCLITGKANDYSNSIIDTSLSEEELYQVFKNARTTYDACLKSNIGCNTQQSKSDIIAELDTDSTKLRTLKELYSLIAELNSVLGCRFPSTQQGCTQAINFAKTALAISTFDYAWRKRDSLDRAYKKALQIRSQIGDVLGTINQTYGYVCEILYSQEYANWEVNPERIMNSLHDKTMQLDALKSELDELLRHADSLKIRDSMLQTSMLRQEELSFYKNKREQLEAIIALMCDVSQQVNQDIPHCGDGLVKVSALVQILLLPNKFYVKWFADNHYSQTKSTFGSLKNTLLRMRELKKDIDSVWTQDFYKLQASVLLDRFRTDYTSFFKRLGGQYRQDKSQLVAAKKSNVSRLEDPICISWLEKLREYQALQQSLADAEETNRSLFGEYYHGAETDVDSLGLAITQCDCCEMYYSQYGFSDELVALCEKPYSVRSGIVFSGSTIKDICDKETIKNAIDNTKSYITTFDEELKAAEQSSDVLTKIDHVLDLILHTVIENTSLAFGSQGETTDYSQIVLDDEKRILELYQALISSFDWYMSEEPSIKEALPRVYAGINTDWNAVLELLNTAMAIRDKLRSGVISYRTIEWLSRTHTERAATTINQRSIEEVIKYINSIDFSQYTDSDTKLFENAIDQLERKIECVSTFINAYNALEGQLCDGVDVDRIYSTFQLLSKCFNVIQHIRSESARLADIFRGYGFTDFDEAYPILKEYLEQYFNYEEINNAVEETSQSIENAVRSDYIDTFNECQSRFMNVLDDQNDSYQTFTSWFANDELVNLQIDELATRVEACKEIESLQSWIEFSSISRTCDKNGLKDYLAYIRENQITTKLMISAYKKAFLSRWLLDLLISEQITPLIEFQSYAHEKEISDFRIHDAKQLILAQSRLAEILSQNKPSGKNIMTNAMDEISILRREAEKKRNIMPLRKLFKVIPSLLQKIKPCFMMSPLSVSYFLDSELYLFDMVIFDEASQILPEDAIGAIYRGKQVIIAGDTKQMPPTNFFNASANSADTFDSSEDEDDEYIPDIVSESILDEANSYLPSCTLLWHYRSKDESLIAFSNKEIYDGRLVTFPNCRRNKDSGLELVYVPNGCYEDRSNIMEARKCVELVEKHIQSHPNRTLGIIAFSEKQQGVIEDAINDFRVRHPQYESFFDEAKEEPFFIKNLENVQGDERDTIIFSVCYARNRQGKMYMRFGPLGLAGGERRLNVAITRAKYNVKLVSSIMPNDIDLNKTKAEGVKLLREYIYYALQNDYELPVGSDTAITDDNLIDIIADFIIQNGYAVRRNIGESQYKIDIAVVDPSSETEYFAGIECDGENYTMARTARDRDTLRKDIMTSMGWNLYHVWSFAWYNTPQQEKRRLLDFLANASAQHMSNGNSQRQAKVPLITNNAEKLRAENLVIEKETVHEEHRLTFAKYREYNIWSYKYDTRQDNITNLACRIMALMECEAPIHRDLLYRKLAPVVGSQKVTVVVRRSVDDCIARKLSGKIEDRNGFLYLTGMIDIAARVPNGYIGERDIEYICPEEIQDAMINIIKFAFALPLEDLVAETARTFGFTRTGPKIREALLSNYQELISCGIFRVVDEKIYVKEEQ